ncbi:hypothetical protein BpHYR1_047818 [Brachionus plicatilis]|uniref:Uncharacterized protein n=1 Tax=Brachionus plicatilis TaxID=10195 RepID=A0A3M7RT16_BRAPC|nr:hypothetical protein BpHYR1_047818 [Brachionus plicatilis]
MKGQSQVIVVKISREVSSWSLEYLESIMSKAFDLNRPALKSPTIKVGIPLDSKEFRSFYEISQCWIFGNFTLVDRKNKFFTSNYLTCHVNRKIKLFQYE